MDNIKEEAKEKGYVKTLFNRRRYIPELKSNNYMVRQFGARAAMNTPIQGTAADIMKIAMIKVYNELKKRNLKSNFKQADRLNAKYIIIVGEDEIKSNTLTLKNNKTKEEYKIKLDDLVEFLDKGE